MATHFLFALKLNACIAQYTSACMELRLCTSTMNDTRTIMHHLPRQMVMYLSLIVLQSDFMFQIFSHGDSYITIHHVDDFCTC